MANDFYNRGANFNPDELADGDSIEAEFDSVSRGFDTIEQLVNLNKAGYPTQTFHVAPATNPDHAVQKTQLDQGLLTKQPIDALLTSIAALITSADKIAYFTGVDSVAMAPLTAFARTLLDDVDSSAARATLGAQASDATLTSLASITTAADKLIYATGSDVFSTTTLTAFARSLLDDVDATTMLATLGALSISGTAVAATKLATARTIALSGDVSGSVAFDGSANATITAVIADDSHAHTIANVDGLQAALDAKVSTSAYATKLLASNGYQKLPSGLILQWGTTAATINMDGSATVTLPTAFPTACLSAQVTAYGSVTGGGVGPVMGIGSFSTTQIVILNDNNAGWYGMWFAIGY